MIAFEKLTFAYDSDRPLFDKVSFEVEVPGFHALFGRSGIGKSTLARILAGLQNGWSAERSDLPAKVLYCHCRERLPRWQSIKEHLDEVISANCRDHLEELMVAFSLEPELLGQRPAELSSGQHNRFNLLRYLLQDFELLILDEALNNVDEPTRLAALAEMKKAFPNRSFLYISHQILDVVSFAKRLILLTDSAEGATLVCRNGLDLDNYSADAAQDLAEQVGDMIRDA